MFNLEKAIADWREQMLAVGIKFPAPLEELEIHLREDIARQMQAGLTAGQAFKLAAASIGHAPELKGEFMKIGPPLEIGKIIKLAGIFSLVIALAGQVLACAPVVFHFAFAHGLKLGLIAKLLPLAGWLATVAITLLSWSYGHKFLPVIRNQFQRRAIGFACYAGCLLWMRFGLFHLPIGEVTNVFMFALVYFLFGAEWAVIAILGGIAYGLERTAWKNTATTDS